MHAYEDVRRASGYVTHVILCDIEDVNPMCQLIVK